MTAQAIRKTLALAILGAAGLAATGAAHAGGVNWSIGINLPPIVIGSGGPGYYPPVAYGPPPVVYAPAPIVYAPPPVYYRPAPIGYYRAPVVVHGGPRGYWREGRWVDDRRKYRGDHRGDDRKDYRRGHDRHDHDRRGDDRRWREADNRAYSHR